MLDTTKPNQVLFRPLSKTVRGKQGAAGMRTACRLSVQLPSFLHTIALACRPILYPSSARQPTCSGRHARLQSARPSLVSDSSCWSGSHALPPSWPSRPLYLSSNAAKAVSSPSCRKSGRRLGLRGQPASLARIWTGSAAVPPAAAFHHKCGLTPELPCELAFRTGRSYLFGQHC